MKWFKKEEMARCFRENGARCRECPLKQPAEKLPDDAEENLEGLVANVLDPARERYGRPIAVNSGYRCAIHNSAVGGVRNSQHMKGEAADITAGSPAENKKLVEIIKEIGKYDQLIIYPTLTASSSDATRDSSSKLGSPSLLPRFVHVSYKRNGVNRRQVLRKTDSGYAKV